MVGSVNMRVRAVRVMKRRLCRMERGGGEGEAGGEVGEGAGGGVGGGREWGVVVNESAVLLWASEASTDGLIGFDGEEGRDDGSEW